MLRLPTKGIDHHAAGEDRGQERLSHQVLVCVCCISFSGVSPLPGGTRLAALRGHDLRNGLKGSNRRGYSQKTQKKGAKRV